jgi:hypothetical protein
MKKLILLFCLFSTSVFAQVLPANAPERQQLIAMGAEILLEKKGDNFTFFKLGGDLFFVGKNELRTVVGRNFLREKKINSVEELELYRIVNKINVSSAFQFVLFEKSLQANAYIFGSHDPKVFASIILSASKVESEFDANPRIFTLLNN